MYDNTNPFVWVLRHNVKRRKEFQEDNYLLKYTTERTELVNYVLFGKVYDVECSYKGVRRGGGGNR